MTDKRFQVGDVVMIVQDSVPGFPSKRGYLGMVGIVDYADDSCYRVDPGAVAHTWWWIDERLELLEAVSDA